jgi:hypothetical protein
MGVGLGVDRLRWPVTIDPIAQQAYLKASNPEASDRFGSSVTMDGETVVIGAPRESSNSTGVNGNQANNSASSAGAAYVFVRSGSTWSQQGYLKASNTKSFNNFAFSVAVSGDTVIIGATGEFSSATGVNGNDNQDNSWMFGSAGASYVFSSFFGTPSTVAEFIARGRIWLAQGASSVLGQAAADFTSALALDAMVALDKNGQLDAQHVLTASSSLLKFAASDRRPQFAAALRAMQQDYASAAAFIRSYRVDPANLLTEDLDPDSPQEIKTRDTLVDGVGFRISTMVPDP